MKKHLWVLAIIVGICLAAPLLTGADPTRTNPEAFLHPPSSVHLLGTDHLGRDVWSRLLWGGQRTLFLGFAVTVLSLSVGILLTTIILILPRLLRELVNTTLTSLVTLPPIIIGLLVLTLIERGADWIVLATALAQVPSLVVVLVARASLVEKKDYVLAALSMGASHIYILQTHVRKGLQPAILALGVLNLSYALGMIATLNFLGLGDAPGIPEWGVMIADGRLSFLNAWWIPLGPGLALTIVIATVNSLTKFFEDSSLGD